MAYEKFIEEYLNNGLLNRQAPNFLAVEKLINRSAKELNAAEANLNIDEGIAYTVAYLAMLHAGRAFMLLKGFRPSDGYQHKTVIEFMSQALGAEYKNIVERFDRIRRKRNIFTYEVDISISKTEADSALKTAVKFVDLIKETVKKESPQVHFKF